MTAAGHARKLTPRNGEPQIGDYGLIGDTRTAALVSSQGSIDWMCLPRFDSEPIFGRLVGGHLGGRFSVRPENARNVSRRYVGNSATLETSWVSETGEASLTDGMVVDVTSQLLPQVLLVRRFACTSGEVEGRLHFNPLRGLPGKPPTTTRRANALVCNWGAFALTLQTAPHLTIAPAEETPFRLRSGDQLVFVMTIADRSPLMLVEPDEALRLLEGTSRWWDEWAAESTYSGPEKYSVERSLVTLRLLTFSPSGAPVAAPTTSLPEVVGGSSNWDYRYSWPRDASLGIDAFLSVGKHEEPKGFIRWLLHADRLTRPELQVVYNVYGKTAPKEVDVPELPGFSGSRPVRFGNKAREQFQLDVYGWVFDAAWRFEQAGHPLYRETLRSIAASADFVCDNWQRPDNGIWEIRGERKHYVQSKLMCWLALERAIDLGRGNGTKQKRLQRWESQRDALAETVKSRGLGDGGVFVRSYESQDLDAAVLVPLIELEDLKEISLLQTVKAIRDQLAAGGPLLYRYPPDGSNGREGAFLACSFWLVQALAVAGQLDEAGALFEAMCSRANDIGLYAEEMDPTTGSHLGNFPQALTHASLIRAAVTIEAAQEGRKKVPSINPNTT